MENIITILPHVAWGSFAGRCGACTHIQTQFLFLIVLWRAALRAHRVLMRYLYHEIDIFSKFCRDSRLLFSEPKMSHLVVDYSRNVVRPNILRNLFGLKA